MSNFLKAFGLALIVSSAMLAPPFAIAETSERHVALVIGNGAYRHTSRLGSPRRDAARMAILFRELGFEVEILPDARRRRMADAIEAFEKRVSGADTAVIYYSGHGMEIRGENYLMPVDARRASPQDGVAMSLAMAAVEKASRLSVVIMDACRTNTLDTSEKSGAKGFAPVAKRKGQIVAFSTSPGTVAYAGEDNELSPYTRALNDVLDADPDIDVRLLFSSLGERTEDYAGTKQVPWVSLGGFPLGHVPLSLNVAAAGRNETPIPVAPKPPDRNARCGQTIDQDISCLWRNAQ